MTFKYGVYPHRTASGQGILKKVGRPPPPDLQILPGRIPAFPAARHQLYKRFLHILQEMERVIIQNVHPLTVHQKITLSYQILTIENRCPFLYHGVRRQITGCVRFRIYYSIPLI